MAEGAHLLSGRPQVEFLEDGFRMLVRDLVVDLGVSEPELEQWEIDSHRGGVDWRVGRSGGAGTVVRVAAGLVYDGASIPPFSQYIMGSKELYEVAGVTHDALYQWQAPRSSADLVFWTIARSGLLRVGSKRAWLGWLALRTFGWIAYRARRIGGAAQQEIGTIVEKVQDAAADPAAALIGSTDA